PWTPDSEMSGIGSNHPILRQNLVDSLAQRTWVDEPCVRLVGVREIMVVARTDSLARSIVAATGFRTSCTKLSQQGFRCRSCIAQHGKMYWPLVAQPRGFDIDLCNGGVRRDQPPFLGSPLREAYAKSKNEVAFGNQLVRGGRGKATANAKRPWILRKQPMAAKGGRKQCV